MELSCRADYAIVAMLELATHYVHKKPLKVSEIASSQGIPDRYLDQILTTMRRLGLVESQRGAKGGYFLAREPWKITLLDVVSSIEGESKAKDSENSEAITMEKTVMLEALRKAEEASRQVLSNYTLEDLCEQRDAYKQTHPMFYI